MKKNKKLIIFGTRDYAQIVYEYFTHDSEYQVEAFTVGKDYLKEKEFMGQPVVAFEELEEHYPPSEYEFHAAIVYGEINRLRARICEQAKQKGYKLASYVSSRAFVWHNVKLGEHCFIFEDNTVQPFVTLGNNVILWSGNHIGHHSTIDDNVFVSSHVVVSGFCRIGAGTFLGVNTAIGNHLSIGKECWVGQGAVISKDVPDGSLVKGAVSEVGPLDLDRLFCYLNKVAGG